MRFDHVDTEWQSAPTGRAHLSESEWGEFLRRVRSDSQINRYSARDAMQLLRAVAAGEALDPGTVLDDVTDLVHAMPAEARTRGLLARASARAARGRLDAEGADSIYEWAAERASEPNETIAVYRELAHWQLERGDLAPAYQTLRAVVDRYQGPLAPSVRTALVQAHLDAAALCELVAPGVASRDHAHRAAALVEQSEVPLDTGVSHAALVARAQAISESTSFEDLSSSPFEVVLAHARLVRSGSEHAVVLEALVEEARLSLLTSGNQHFNQIVEQCVADMRAERPRGFGVETIGALGVPLLVTHGHVEPVTIWARARIGALHLRWHTADSSLGSVEAAAEILNVLDTVDGALAAGGWEVSTFRQWGDAVRTEVARVGPSVLGRVQHEMLTSYSAYGIEGVGSEAVAVARLTEHCQGRALAAQWWMLAGRVQTFAAEHQPLGASERSQTYLRAHGAFDRAATAYDVFPHTAPEARAARVAAHDVLHGRAPDLGR